jgi:hypothetical protein
MLGRLSVDWLEVAVPELFAAILERVTRLWLASG